MRAQLRILALVAFTGTAAIFTLTASAARAQSDRAERCAAAARVLTPSEADARRGSATPLIMGALIRALVYDRLNCDELTQVAATTDEVIARAQENNAGVGTTQSWQSQCRDGVRGSSTVTAVEDNCMTVTDIIIVDGQEQQVPKRMCRQPPSRRYVRVA